MERTSGLEEIGEDLWAVRDLPDNLVKAGENIVKAGSNLKDSVVENITSVR
jgi:hypothetical protein